MRHPPPATDCAGRPAHRDQLGWPAMGTVSSVLAHISGEQRHQPGRPPPNQRSHAFKLRRQIPLVPVRTRRRSSLAALVLSISCRVLAASATNASRRRSRAAMLRADRTVRVAEVAQAAPLNRLGGGDKRHTNKPNPWALQGPMARCETNRGSSVRHLVVFGRRIGNRALGSPNRPAHSVR
jgi:hypothetical protein